MINIIESDLVFNALYHSTHVDSAIRILRTNSLETGYGDNSDSSTSICFTTNPNYILDKVETPIQLVLDYNKLSKDYRCYNFNELEDARDSESEVRVDSNIYKLSKYLMKINLTNSSDYYINGIINSNDIVEYFDIDYWKQLINLIKIKNISINKEFSKLIDKLLKV